MTLSFWQSKFSEQLFYLQTSTRDVCNLFCILPIGGHWTMNGERILLERMVRSMQYGMIYGWTYVTIWFLSSLVALYFTPVTHSFVFSNYHSFEDFNPSKLQQGKDAIWNVLEMCKGDICLNICDNLVLRKIADYAKRLIIYLSEKGKWHAVG